MSTASSIDLLVDLKEIQSRSPRVAFPLLWEIKRLHSPCLSALIVIISPSSPVVCGIFPLPWIPLTACLLHVNTFLRSFSTTSFVVPIQIGAEHRTAAMQIIISQRKMLPEHASAATVHLQCVQTRFGGFIMTHKRLTASFQIKHQSISFRKRRPWSLKWPPLSCPSRYLLLFVRC